MITNLQLSECCNKTMGKFGDRTTPGITRGILHVLNNTHTHIYIYDLSTIFKIST